MCVESEHIFLMLFGTYFDVCVFFFTVLVEKVRRLSTHASKQQERKQAPKLATASKLCNHGRQKYHFFFSGCADSVAYALMALFGQVGGN